ncbi:MAG: flagellin [Candidatus Marinimicrobia bacterium]|nr:flagellin [Candidatus Neomarinimicrobiota bacterium]
MSLTRIAANIQAMNSLQSLKKVNSKMNLHQTRLSTGRKINSAADDPAGFALARGLESRRRGLDVALQNVSNAKNILNVAEGGYQAQMDILQTVKEKATQAADYSLSSAQRSAIDDQVTALLNEIDDIEDETTFNDNNLIDGSYSGSFQTGESSSDQISVSLASSNSGSMGASGTDVSSVDLTTAGGASAAIDTVSSAIDSLSGAIQDIGEYTVRLNSKETSLSTASTNTEAVRSSVEDADFAKEQMEVMKLQIQQQTALSSFSQANTSPQSVLSLFG